jgi:chemotaxis protein methyltransferase CheR
MEEFLNDDSYVAMLEAIKEKYGYDFNGYTPSSLKRRVSRFMLSHKIQDTKVLTELLIADDVTFELFVQSLSVTVTEMFRDPPFFLSLKQNVLTRLATYPIIKIWLAGCATGQEVFSTAILLHEANLLDRTILYATDINQQSLMIARQGIYSKDEISRSEANYTAAGGNGRLANYYIEHQSAVLFKRFLIEKAMFSPHNLATDKSFNEFQLILCRNVIMYFNRELQEKVISLFFESLCPFGYIGLGDKESFHFSGLRNAFEIVDQKQKIYRKIVGS